jgi:hypothetical protein
MFSNDDMPVHKKAKLDVLKALRQVAMELIKEKADEGETEASELQKVSVMADDKEGLEQGLDKAKDVLESMPEGEEEENSMGDEPAEEDEEASLMAKLQELRNKKKMLKV